MRDKVVLITGASSGIGEETAKQFAALGATVLLLARKEERLRRVAESIRVPAEKRRSFRWTWPTFKRSRRAFHHTLYHEQNRIQEEMNIVNRQAQLATF